jgi:hypothetical protein
VRPCVHELRELHAIIVMMRKLRVLHKRYSGRYHSETACTEHMPILQRGPKNRQRASKGTRAVGRLCSGRARLGRSEHGVMPTFRTDKASSTDEGSAIPEAPLLLRDEPRTGSGEQTDALSSPECGARGDYDQLQPRARCINEEPLHSNFVHWLL